MFDDEKAHSIDIRFNVWESRVKVTISDAAGRTMETRHFDDFNTLEATEYVKRVLDNIIRNAEG